MPDMKTEDSLYGEFSQLASLVLQSPLFYQEPPVEEQDPEKVIAFVKELRARQETLSQALGDAESLEDLSPEAKKIWDEALHALNVASDDEFFFERMSMPPIVQMPAEVAKLLDPATSELLALAILECTEKGDHEAAKKIAELAKTPEKVHEILGSSQRVRPSSGNRANVEKSYHAMKNLPRVRPSPFKRK